MIVFLVFLTFLLVFALASTLVFLARAVEVLNGAEISAAALLEICRNMEPPQRTGVRYGRVVPGRVLISDRDVPKAGWDR